MAILYERPIDGWVRILRKFLENNPELEAEVKKLEVTPLKKIKISSKKKKCKIAR